MSSETIELLLDDEAMTQEVDPLPTSEISFEALTREHVALDLLELERAEAGRASATAGEPIDITGDVVARSSEAEHPAPTVSEPIGSAAGSPMPTRSIPAELGATPALPIDAAPVEAEETRIQPGAGPVPSPPRQPRSRRGTHAAAGPSAAGSRGRLRRPLLAALVAVLALALAAGVGRGRGMRPAAPAAAREAESRSAEALRGALDLARAERFEEARSALEGATGEEVERARAELDREVRAGRALDQAGAALAALDLAGASRALSTVDRSTLAGKKTGALEQEIETRRAGRVESLAAEVATGSASARRELEELRQAFPGESSIERALGQRGPRPGRREHPEESGALARYRAGDLAGALAALGTSGADGRRQLRRRIADLQRALRTGTVLSGARAIQPLESARELDSKLGGSSLGGEIKERLVKAHEEVARTALQSGDPGAAFRHYSRVRDIAPEEGEAVTQLETLRNQARQLYLSAYVERDTDPASAIEKLRKVVAQTPEGEDVHEKARRWLDRLDGAGRGRADATAGG